MNSEQLVKTYWWREEPNFGDALSPLIAREILGVGCEWAPIHECDLMLVGSVLQLVTERCSPVVVGTGFIEETSSADIRGSKILSVRGPLTRAKIGGECLLGDPGILAAEAIGVSVVGGQGTVVAPHYIDNELAFRLPGLPTIDVRQAPEVVISELARFDRVVTSSLHVLIAADSLGIERVWAPHPEVIGNGFKFHDYSASLTSAIEPWVTTTAHPSRVAALKEQVWEALGRVRELLC